MYFPGLSRSGSDTQVVLRGADSVGPAFCALPRSSSSGVWRARSLRLIASPGPAAQFSGCTTGAPSQADDDCPEPQEVLVSKGACLQFGRQCLSGAAIAPFLALLALAACNRRGMVCSWLILFRPLFCARSWWCLMLELFAW